MAEGLYPDGTIVERFVASPTPSTIAQRFFNATDSDILGMGLYCTTAPGTGNGISVNLSCVPTSQVTNVPAGAANQSVTSPYTLWSAANVPTILGSAVTNVTTAAPAANSNTPYALNYPLPGPSGTSGLRTAQATSYTTENPTTSPGQLYLYQMVNPYPPDLTYYDLNNQLQNTYRIHAGDILSFVITAAGANNSVGSVANLEIVLVLVKT